MMKHAVRNLKKPLGNERGMATIETVPLIFVFVLLLCYELGMFGVIHTGIMNSISSRAYAFETFRNRTTLVYFRDVPTTDFRQYRTVGNRTHAVKSEVPTNSNSMGIATERPIRVGMPLEADVTTRTPATHNEKVFDQALIGPQKRNTTVGVNPVWLQVQYGICLSAKCEI